MMNKQELLTNLAHFSGTDRYYPHQALNILLSLTDGCLYLRAKANCFWLFDIIASYQVLKKVREEGFQVYELTVNHEQSSAKMVCSDGNDNILQEQKIPYTNFPLDSIKIYFINGVAMLPSEY